MLNVSCVKVLVFSWVRNLCVVLVLLWREEKGCLPSSISYTELSSQLRSLLRGPVHEIPGEKTLSRGQILCFLSFLLSVL